LFLFLPAGASSQRVLSSVDISGTAVRYADSIRASGVSLSPAFRVDWSHATLSTSADVSALAGNATVQGTIAPSVFTRSVGPMFAELSASSGGSTHEDGTHTGQILGIARAYYAAGIYGGAWFGAGAGQTWDGTAWQRIIQGELGAWIDRSAFTTLVTLTPVRVGAGIRYNDLGIAVRYPGNNLEVGASLGGRMGNSSPVLQYRERVWGTVSALHWVSSRLALVVSAGSYPVDLTQGFPGGRFATLALRIASPNTRRATETLPSSNESVSSSSTIDVVAAGSFSLHTEAGNKRVISVDAPGASAVEISGDFTQWQPVALVRGADGLWTITRSIPRGTYEVTIRLDGGPWVAPPGLLKSRDELGAVVGILSIE
jgi:hypothetical protein